MTQLGRLMVEFPLQPDLTRALLQAAALGCEELLLPVAAMLSVENIFIRPGSPRFHLQSGPFFKVEGAHAPTERVCSCRR